MRKSKNKWRWKRAESSSPMAVYMPRTALRIWIVKLAGRDVHCTVVFDPTLGDLGINFLRPIDMMEGVKISCSYKYPSNNKKAIEEQLDLLLEYFDKIRARLKIDPKAKKYYQKLRDASPIKDL